MASNDSTLRDEDGDYSDWIEIHNPDSASISLAGYHLTDDPENLDKWTFPEISLNPGEYLVIFASGKNRLDSAGRLHTDFQLSAEGEFLALVAPDATRVLSSFAPLYPTQFEDESFGLSPGTEPAVWAYFPTPTPGASNGDGTRAGPVFEVVERKIPQPAPGPLTISAAIYGVNAPINTVRLFYRRMHEPETMLLMTDNGSAGDAAAGDGIWTGVIPAASVRPGEMIRWRYVATDTAGVETKEPAFRTPVDSHQYFGTVPQDPEIQTALPVFHWFTTSAGGAGTSTGSRGAVYYLNELYDNVLFSLHGQSSSGFPKKSYNIDFNRTQRFEWSTNAPRVADIDLITNWADKSKVRHVLGYEVMRESGVAAHFAYTVRVEQNGSFFSTADFIEDADEIYLERAGLNPEGALYKVYSNLLNRDGGDSSTSGVEKKTRQFENNNDLRGLIDGLDLTGSALVNYLYDNIDLPRCVNMLAANSVIRNIDMHRKNWYIYRDTGRSGEWAILPWDLDLSHGRVWNTENTYFDNVLYTDGFVVTGTSIRLVSHLFNNSVIRGMILRRIRTLTDQFLQPPPAPGTPESSLYYERRLNEQSALIDPPEIVPSDARRDFEKWGSWLQAGRQVSYTNTNPAVETMEEAIGRWKTEYLPRRRQYIYNTQVVGRGGQIPEPQTGGPTFNFTPLLTKGARVQAIVPSNGDLGVTWAGSSFTPAGWISGETGVGYERGTGYESLIRLSLADAMGTNTSFYLRVEFEVADPAAFERLELRMQYDDGFVAFLNGAVLASANAPVSLRWNSAATASHEANAATFDVFDVTTRMGNLRKGRNVLAIQGLNDNAVSSDLLIVPELYGGVTGTPQNVRQPVINFGTIEATPASGIPTEEFVQLLNPNAIAVDISDWRIIGGIEHRFSPGTVLPPSGTLYLSPDAAAFRARAVSPKGGEGRFVQGGYQGRLASGGETLTLVDASGVTNNTTTYQGQPSDAQRYLVTSELMYHPNGDGLAEFVELLNTSDSVTLNLADVRFTQGIEFDFTTSAIRSLPPGARALIVRDRAAFYRVYGTNLPVAGVFANGSALSNSGETLRLEDADREIVQEFAFGDDEPWPAEVDGEGRSLVLIDPQGHRDPAVPGNWKASSSIGGSPGRADLPSGPSDPMADRDGNGERDLIDYALGNAVGEAPVYPILQLEQNSLAEPPSLRLSYPVSSSAANVELSIFYSTDLVTWNAGANHFELDSRQPLGDGRELITWRVKAPLSDESPVFIRLRAVQR